MPQFRSKPAKIPFLLLLLIVGLLCLVWLASSTAFLPDAVSLASEAQSAAEGAQPSSSILAEKTDLSLTSPRGGQGKRIVDALGWKPMHLGNVLIFVSPATTNAQVGDIFSVNVRANAYGNEVDAAEVFMSFDPTYLEIQSMTPGTALNQPLPSSYNNGSGTVNYAAGRLTDPPSTVSGKFTLFTLEIRAKEPVASTLLNITGAQVAVAGSPHSVSMQAGTVVIVAPTPTPTQTNTPTKTLRPTITNTPLTTPVPQPTPTDTRQPGAQEIVIRDFEDTFLDLWNLNTSYCSDWYLRLRAPSVKHILIRPDLSEVPPNSLIDEAVLKLYQTSDTGQTNECSVYAVLRVWDCEKATWVHAAANSPWSVPGCDAAGTDRASNPSLERELFSTFPGHPNYPVDFDVTTLIQQWLNKPDTNHGLVIICPAGTACEFIFASADYHDESLRPELMIRYREAPTATPTLTPTLTLTPEPKGLIHGVVFDDQNGNGERDAGEPGVVGATIELRDLGDPAFVETRESDLDGRYAFAGLEPGTYRMSVSVVPQGYEWIDELPESIPMDSGTVLEIPIPLQRSGSALYLPLITRDFQ